MAHFSELINFCLAEYNKLPFCDNCKMPCGCKRSGRDDCYNCLNHIHRIYNKSDHYSCDKIAFNYILKHGHRYASEISKAFKVLRARLAYCYPLRIISLGCGPSTELYGASQEFSDRQIKYLGLDRAHIWKQIQEYNLNLFNGNGDDISYSSDDFFYIIETDEEDWDVLVLNYFLSDFVKFSPDAVPYFIERLAQKIESGSFRHIIINDIPLFYPTGSAFSCIVDLMKRLNPKKNTIYEFNPFHFKVPKVELGQKIFGRKVDDSLIFPITEPGIERFEPFESCGSIQLIISLKR